MKNKYIKLLICFVIITLMFTGCNSKKENNEVTQNESIKIDKEEVIEEETDDKPSSGSSNNNQKPSNSGSSNNNQKPSNSGSSNNDDKQSNNSTSENNKKPSNGSTTENNQKPSNSGSSNNNEKPSNGGTTNTTTKYGTVVIKYVDEDNESIATPKTDNTAKVGSTYNYKAPSIIGYTNINTTESVSITKENEKKEIIFKYANQDFVPYISLYFVTPTVKTGEETKLKFYVTDYYQREYRDDDNSKTFTIRISVDGKQDIVKTLSAGVHEISLGSFANEGNVDFTIMATDQYGRNSHKIYHYFRVKNVTPRKEYSMTTADLTKYNIKNDDSYAIRKYVDVNEISDNIINTMSEAYDNESVPDGKYVVLIPRNINDNNKFGYKLYKYVRVKYSSTYNKDNVLQESVNTRTGLQNFLDDKVKEGYNYVKLLPGTYRIDHQKSIYMPSNLTLDMNQATIKLNQFTGDSAYMLSLDNTYDSHLINGNFEGDYYEHDYINSPNNSEWPLGIGLSGNAEYSSIENVNVRDITGYGVVTSMSKKEGYTYFQPTGLSNFKNVDINRQTGEEINNPNRLTSDYKDLSKVIGTSKYIQISKYLGYQGRIGNSWNLIVHFYDENKKLIESVDGYQYRRIKLPVNAKFLRVTLLNAKGITNEDASNLTVVYFKVPTNSIVKNVLIDNARCVGMAPSQMNNLLFTDMEFTRNGQTGAFSAMDAEDGWDQMQDITFRNLDFHDNHRNDFLTCAGHNFIVENMIRGNLHIYGRTNSFVYENNKNSTTSNLKVFANYIARGGYYRIQNNNLKSASIGSDNNNFSWPIHIKNTTFTERAVSVVELDETTKKFKQTSGYYKNCKLIYNNPDRMGTGEGVFKNCIISGYNGENFGGYYIDSTFENITGNMHKTFQFENCKISNINVNGGAYEPHLYIDNSTITNYSHNNIYWSEGYYMDIRNSTINNEQHFLRTPTYSVKYPVIFTNNKITLNGDKGLITFYDNRQHGDYERTYFMLDNNTINAPNSKYVFTGLTDTKDNKFGIILKGNTLNSGLTYLEPNVESYPNITVTRK